MTSLEERSSTKELEESKNRIPADKICFSFIYFQLESISIHGFNNYYPNKLSSINAVNDFFETIKQMGRKTKKELFTNEMKEYFHLHEIRDDDEIELIERILREGYKFPQKHIDQFERTYIQFSTTGGKRVIAALLHGTLFECLFFDNNHFIYRESCKNIKEKQGYKIKSAFEKWDENMLNMQTPMFEEYFEMLMEDYKQGKIKTIEEIYETYTEIKRDFCK